MSKFTTEVRYICETAAGLDASVGFDSLNDLLAEAAPNVFNFDFPIFDENYRLPLEVKILRNFYTREICEETVGLWKLRLQQKLQEIMPYYNKLYESELLEFNPLYDFSYTANKTVETEGTEETTGTSRDTHTGTDTYAHTGTDNRTTTDNGSVTHGKKETTAYTGQATLTDNFYSDDIDKYSDTPQGALSGVMADEYLTNARVVQHRGNNTHDTTFVNRIDETTNSGTDTSTGSGSNNRTVNLNDQRTANLVDTGNTSGTKDINNLETYIETVSGKRGGASYSKMLMEFRETFLNIDAMILNDLNSLFFGLWE